ncbi:MAG: type II secretion system protein GspG [Phycisphaerae bacterium]|nr:type II secretion system protein GspG [Phycisphaerae bacterium]
MMRKTVTLSKDRNRAGFSLVELMVVIVIIGLLAGVVGVNVIDMIYKGKVGAAKAQMATFETGIDNFKIDTGQYPVELAELANPGDITGASPTGYLKGATEIPLDPWNNEYVYELTGDSITPYTLYCTGADGMDGAENEEGRDFNVKGYLDAVE